MYVRQVATPVSEDKAKQTVLTPNGKYNVILYNWKFSHDLEHVYPQLYIENRAIHNSTNYLTTASYKLRNGNFLTLSSKRIVGVIGIYNYSRLLTYCFEEKDTVTRIELILSLLTEEIKTNTVGFQTRKELMSAAFNSTNYAKKKKKKMPYPKRSLNSYGMLEARAPCHQTSHINQNPQPTTTQPQPSIIQPSTSKSHLEEANMEIVQVTERNTEVIGKVSADGTNVDEVFSNDCFNSITIYDGTVISIPYKPEDLFHITAPEIMKFVTKEEQKKLILHQAFVDYQHCLQKDQDGLIVGWLEEIAFSDKGANFTYPILGEFCSLNPTTFPKEHGSKSQKEILTSIQILIRLIHLAILNDDFDLLKRQCVVLRARGHSVDVISYNMTPLQMALSMEKRENFAKFLIDRGADLLCKRDGRTALHIIAEKTGDDADLAGFAMDNLLKNVRTVIEDNRRLWCDDMQNKTDKQLRKHLMIQIGHMFDKQGYNPLMLATRCGNPKVLQAFLKHCPKIVDIQTPNYGKTALSLATHEAIISQITDRSFKKHAKVIQVLVSHNANPLITTKNGETVFDLLMGANQNHILEPLKKFISDVMCFSNTNKAVGIYEIINGKILFTAAKKYSPKITQINEIEAIKTDNDKRVNKTISKKVNNLMRLECNEVMELENDEINKNNEMATVKINDKLEIMDISEMEVNTNDNENCNSLDDSNKQLKLKPIADLQEIPSNRGKAIRLTNDNIKIIPFHQMHVEKLAAEHVMQFKTACKPKKKAVKSINKEVMQNTRKTELVHENDKSVTKVVESTGEAQGEAKKITVSEGKNINEKGVKLILQEMKVNPGDKNIKLKVQKMGKNGSISDFTILAPTKSVVNQNRVKTAPNPKGKKLKYVYLKPEIGPKIVQSFTLNENTKKDSGLKIINVQNVLGNTSATVNTETTVNTPAKINTPAAVQSSSATVNNKSTPNIAAKTNAGATAFSAASVKTVATVNKTATLKPINPDTSKISANSLIAVKVTREVPKAITKKVIVKLPSNGHSSKTAYSIKLPSKVTNIEAVTKNTAPLGVQTFKNIVIPNKGITLKSVLANKKFRIVKRYVRVKKQKPEDIPFIDLSKEPDLNNEEKQNAENAAENNETKQTEQDPISIENLETVNKTEIEDKIDEDKTASKIEQSSEYTNENINDDTIELEIRNADEKSEFTDSDITAKNRNIKQICYTNTKKSKATILTESKDSLEKENNENVNENLKELPKNLKNVQENSESEQEHSETIKENLLNANENPKKVQEYSEIKDIIDSFEDDHCDFNIQDELVTVIKILNSDGDEKENNFITDSLTPEFEKSVEKLEKNLSTEKEIDETEVTKEEEIENPIKRTKLHSLDAAVSNKEPIQYENDQPINSSLPNEMTVPLLEIKPRRKWGPKRKHPNETKLEIAESSSTPTSEKHRTLIEKQLKEHYNIKELNIVLEKITDSQVEKLLLNPSEELNKRKRKIPNEENEETKNPKTVKTKPKIQILSVEVIRPGDEIINDNDKADENINDEAIKNINDETTTTEKNVNDNGEQSINTSDKNAKTNDKIENCEQSARTKSSENDIQMIIKL